MTSSQRRLAALVIAPLLVVGLAACAGAEPEAMPTPSSTPTPTPTETIAAPTSPTSRVPATCDELFSSSLIAGGELNEYGSSAVAQAGYLGCFFEGSFGGALARLSVDVSVDPPVEEVQRLLGRAGDPESPGCDARYCRILFFSGDYAVEILVSDYPAGAAPLTPLVEAFTAEIEQRVSSWPTPAPLWQPPGDALRWEFDCAELIPRQDVVRDVVPFPVGDARRAGGDLHYMSFWALAATGTTQCVWDDIGSGVSVEILPGGAWMHEAGIPLPGEPYSFAGALAAARDAENRPSTISAYIDGSLVSVGVSPPEGSGIDGAAVAEAVLAAIVAAF